MKIWTYQEALNKVVMDSDLQDETFINSNEMIGYFNDGIKEAEAEIHVMNAEVDYFLTKAFVPVVAGNGNYALPSNIYANKIRNIMYWNGALIYPINRYRRRKRFENQIFTDQWGQADEYQYELYNDLPGQANLRFHPVLRETAILPPSGNAFTPVIMWYLRNAARIPLLPGGISPTSLLGEFCNPEVLAPAQFNVISNQISTNQGTTTYGVQGQGIIGCYPGSIPLVTGDAVQFQPAPGDTLATPLKAGVTYYVIAVSSGIIQLATTLANAQSNTPLVITGQPGVFSVMTVAAQQNIVNATILDIPEFTEFVIQWARCSALLKELKAVPADESAKLADQKQQMIDALTLAVPDDEDYIEPDYSLYQEMS